MVIVGTRLVVADNSGAKEASCIRILKGKNVAKVGDVIVVAIKKHNTVGRIKSGQVSKAVVVRTKSYLRREDGTKIKFDDNAVVLLDDQMELLATRIFGSVARELRLGDFARIVSLVLEVV